MLRSLLACRVVFGGRIQRHGVLRLSLPKEFSHVAVWLCANSVQQGRIVAFALHAGLTVNWASCRDLHAALGLPMWSRLGPPL